MQPTADDLMRPHRPPSVPLQSLVHTVPVQVHAMADAQVSGLAIQTARVRPGDLFVAVAGQRSHGAQYIEQAIHAGARGVLTDEAGYRIARELDASVGHELPVLVVDDGHDVREIAGQVAATIYGQPAARLTTAGITGTNGKTTTTFFLDAILRTAGHHTGLMGTVETRLGDHTVSSTRTTVEAPELQGFLARCLEEEVTAVSMEVSSHALALHRITGTQFDVVGFTNLQRDHLDFHGSMAEYFAAKAQLFHSDYARAGVINVDDDWGVQLHRQATIDTWSVATTPERAAHVHADWTVVEVGDYQPNYGTQFVLQGPHGQRLRCHSALPGTVNVANAALAALMARLAGVSDNNITEGLRSLHSIPGRMEVVSKPAQPLTIVDYAHTAEALDFALSSLRQDLAARAHESGTHGVLRVVCGAAGDRDPSKRPEMGAVAARLADVVYIADDDPHGEDRATIRQDLLKGAQSEAQRQAAHGRIIDVKEYDQRESAIDDVIAAASDGDIILIAGRGHETVQDMAGVPHELDDRRHARRALTRWSNQHH